jgi:cytochrome c553
MIRMTLRAAVLTALAVLAGSVAAQGGAPAKPDLAKARQIVDQVCAACHGTEGVSSGAANPHLAGQHSEYISLQLEHFKTGVRSNPVMAGMSAALSEEDMRLLGLYFQGKKPKPGAAKSREVAERGARIYRGGIAAKGLPACAGCHSPTGAGIPAQYPRLAGQFAEYTYAQLKAFHDGARGAHDKDANGRTMAAIAAKLSDEEMKAVAEYVAGLR